MASAEQLSAYHSQCSSIPFSSFDADRSVKYDLGEDAYYSDVVKHHDNGGHTLGGLCLLVSIVLIVFGCVLRCVPHRWRSRMDFVGLAKNGINWWQRLLGAVFIAGMITCVVLVIAMSIWGMARVQDGVARVIPESFDFIERVEEDLTSMRDNLLRGTNQGETLASDLQDAVNQLRTDPILTQPGAPADISTQLDTMNEAANVASDAKAEVGTTVNATLGDLVKGMRDAAGYRDEGEAMNDPLQIVVSVAFAIFMLFAVVSSLCSLCRCSPCCILTWAAVMWFMLMITFSLAALLSATREVSRESCLYIDTFAVQQLKAQTEHAPEKTEQLLWYYFRPAEAGNKTEEEVEQLWDFNFGALFQFLDTIENQLFDGKELRSPYDSVQIATQAKLMSIAEGIGSVRGSFSSVRGQIHGETFHDIHKEFKDLICCTEYNAVDSVWTAWTVASVFGMVIAIMLTVQGLVALRTGREDGGQTELAVGQPSEKTPLKEPLVAEPNFTQAKVPFILPIV